MAKTTGFLYALMLDTDQPRSDEEIAATLTELLGYDPKRHGTPEQFYRRPPPFDGSPEQFEELEEQLLKRGFHVSEAYPLTDEDRIPKEEAIGAADEVLRECLVHMRSYNGVEIAEESGKGWHSLDWSPEIAFLQKAIDTGSYELLHEALRRAEYALTLETGMITRAGEHVANKELRRRVESVLGKFPTDRSVLEPLR